jgi:putative membrane protein
MAGHGQPPGDAPGDQQPAGDADPRFLLASERTFLAWNRTALALIAGGLAVARFVTVGSRSAQIVVALLLILFGAFVAIQSHRLWTRNDRALRGGQPLPPSELPAILTGGVGVFALAAVALTILVFVLR